MFLYIGKNEKMLKLTPFLKASRNSKIRNKSNKRMHKTYIWKL